MRIPPGLLVASAFLLQDVFGQTSYPAGLFSTTSAAANPASSPSLIPSGFVLSSSGISGSVTLGSASSSSTSAPVLVLTSVSSLSVSSTASTAPSAVPVCGQPYSAANGTNYQIACGQTYGGDVITPSQAQSTLNRKRQQIVPSFEACIASCASIPECVASAFLLGECTLLSAINSIVNTRGAVAAIRADYVAVLAALASPSTVTTATAPGPTVSTATEGYSSAIGDHLSQKMSDNAPVPTSDNTVVYVTPSMATSSSSIATSSSSVAPFSSQISDYISQHLSEYAPSGTGPDTAIYITSVNSKSSMSVSSSLVDSSSSNASASASVSTALSNSGPAASAAASSQITLPSIVFSTGSVTPSIPIVASSSIASSSAKVLSSSSTTIGSSSSISSSSSLMSSIRSSTSTYMSPSSRPSSSTSSRSSSVQTSSSIQSSAAAISSTSSTSSAVPTPVRNSGKRGLSYNSANLTMPFSLSGQGSQVSWAYDWYYAPCNTPGVNDCNFNPALEFVPLLYNIDPNLLSQWPTAAQIAIDNGSTALMSFNEPDFCISGSACLNVSTAVSYHRQYLQPFAGKALIGAPAITNSAGTDANPMGLQYLEYFLGNCTGCDIDFINLHWYSNKYAGASYFEYYINSARAVAGGRPIWITEFGLDNEFSYTDAELQALLQKVMPWLDQQPDVARYAYFMDAPGILINSAGNAISGTGIVYNSFTNNTLQGNAYTS
ncbi:hypothetical protein E4T45_02364 [Aureobasidium sp. EXF-8846]|nr:hypothetical protein E4T45_02364 [Aureobasidium sp. EXF-8846]